MGNSAHDAAGYLAEGGRGMCSTEGAGGEVLEDRALRILQGGGDGG